MGYLKDLGSHSALPGGGGMTYRQWLTGQALRGIMSQVGSIGMELDDLGNAAMSAADATLEMVERADEDELQDEAWYRTHEPEAKHLRPIKHWTPRACACEKCNPKAQQ